jgi:hypothetical protein
LSAVSLRKISIRSADVLSVVAKTNRNKNGQEIAMVFAVLTKWTLWKQVEIFYRNAFISFSDAAMVAPPKGCLLFGLLRYVAVFYGYSAQHSLSE